LHETGSPLVTWFGSLPVGLRRTTFSETVRMLNEMFRADACAFKNTVNPTKAFYSQFYRR